MVRIGRLADCIRPQLACSLCPIGNTNNLPFVPVGDSDSDATQGPLHAESTPLATALSPQAGLW